jgi:hypothetical protein
MAIIVLYAASISDALRSNASNEELITLREHARAVLEQQGDLAAALKDLEAELESRGA